MTGKQCPRIALNSSLEDVSLSFESVSVLNFLCVCVVCPVCESSCIHTFRDELGRWAKTFITHSVPPLTQCRASLTSNLRLAQIQEMVKSESKKWEQPLGVKVRIEN